MAPADDYCEVPLLDFSCAFSDSLSISHLNLCFSGADSEAVLTELLDSPDIDTHQGTAAKRAKGHPARLPNWIFESARLFEPGMRAFVVRRKAWDFHTIVTVMLGHLPHVFSPAFGLVGKQEEYLKAKEYLEALQTSSGQYLCDDRNVSCTYLILIRVSYSPPRKCQHRSLL